jgi:hypothetical protein
MATLKLFTGLIYWRGKQYSACIAAKSQKRAAEAFGIPAHYLKTYWYSGGGNPVHVAITGANPDTPMVFTGSNSLDTHPDWQKHGEWITFAEFRKRFS